MSIIGLLDLLKLDIKVVVFSILIIFLVTFGF
jgi:hypothetical protein